jgi:hypothetical protein
LFFPSLKKQLYKTTSIFEKTVVGLLHGLGKYKRQLQQKCEDFMTYLFVVDGSTDVTDIELSAVYV